VHSFLSIYVGVVADARIVRGPAGLIGGRLGLGCRIASINDRHRWVLYSDGSVSEGWSKNLGAAGYWAG
jgi:hypothetical protein